MTDDPRLTLHRHYTATCPRCAQPLIADVAIWTTVHDVRITDEGQPLAEASPRVAAVLLRQHACGDREHLTTVLTARAPDDRTERQTWLSGTEAGEVVIECAHPGCMIDGPKTAHNPEGRYISAAEVLPYHVTPEEAQALWDAHLARHDNGGDD